MSAVSIAEAEPCGSVGGGEIGMPKLPRDELKTAFSLFPSGVVIATTCDADGRPHGFTASSFTPLSLDPPMLLVCIARSAQCYPAFMRAEHFAINVLPPEHEALALLFATRGAEKFAGDSFAAGAQGMPVLRDAVASFVCRVAERLPGGDHTILTGEVEAGRCRADGAAMLYFRRRFQSFQQS